MLMPFSSLESYDLLHFDWHSFLSRHSAFELLVLPITSVFSIPFGTHVFLRSESAIRKAVDKAVHATLRSTEREIADLFARRGELSDLQWRQMDELASLHERLASTGSYRSVLISGLSLLVPLIGPVVELLKLLFKGV
jgi:hypothetical protein